MKKQIYIILLLVAATVSVQAQDNFGTLKIEMKLTDTKNNKNESYELRSVDYSINRSYTDSSDTEITLSFIAEAEDPFLLHWIADVSPNMSGVIMITNLENRKQVKKIAFENAILLSQATSYLKGTNHGYNFYYTASLKGVSLNDIQISK